LDWLGCSFQRFDAYCVDNVFLQDGLILNPHTGELRRLHFRLPALVAWAPNPVLRVDIMLRRRPVGTHGQTVRIDDESMDNHVAAIDEALETDEGRKDNRLVYPTPKVGAPPQRSRVWCVSGWMVWVWPWVWM